MSVVRLDACRTEPLLAYLKALGLLTAIAEQLDPSVTGWWHQGRFHVELIGDLGAGELVDFVANRYAPVPIVSPWNRRGGFRLDREQSSEKRLAAIERSDDVRLEPYRRAIAVGRAIWEEASSLGILSKGAVDDKQKGAFVRLCRGRFPDDVLPWLDAAVVLLDDDVRYPDLLGGTGGNLGSGDLSSNAHEAALWLCGQRAPVPYVRGALLGEGDPKLSKLLVGQFSPGGAGGVNMGPSDSMVNPISYLLALHGACLFAAGVARRLDGRKAASVPFTVRVSPGVGDSVADGEKVRAELWLPEWSRPMTLPELRTLLAEGRAQWSGSQSTSSLDFARAAASLGVDRDITHFARYLIAERMGQANLAVPVGRFSVGRRRGVQLTSAIDPFLRSVQRIANPTQAVQGAANIVRGQIFGLAERDTPARARRLLAALFSLERAVGRSRSARETVSRPLQGLRAVDWLPLLDDGSAEYRLARSIASQRERWFADRGRQARETSTMPVLCRPVERNGLRRIGADAVADLAWSDASPPIDLLGHDVRQSMREGWQVRSLRCAQHPPPRQDDEAVVHTPGIDVAFGSSMPCSLVDVAAFGERAIDERRFAEWLAALVMLDWTSARSQPVMSVAGDQRTGISLGPAFGSTVPFFSRHPVPVGDDDGVERTVRFHPASQHVAALARGDIRSATDLATRRLRQFGIDVPAHLRAAAAATGALDAALIPMNRRDTDIAVRSINPPRPSPFAPVDEESA